MPRRHGRRARALGHGPVERQHLGAQVDDGHLVRRRRRRARCAPAARRQAQHALAGDACAQPTGGVDRGQRIAKIFVMRRPAKRSSARTRAFQAFRLWSCGENMAGANGAKRFLWGESSQRRTSERSSPNGAAVCQLNIARTAAVNVCETCGRSRAAGSRRSLPATGRPARGPRAIHRPHPGQTRQRQTPWGMDR